MRLQNLTLSYLLGALLFSTSIFGVVGCSTHKSTTRKPDRVEHVVLCWLKEPGNIEARQKLIDASYSLGSIPGVESVHAGSPLPSDRPVVDDSFDVGIVFILEDREALQTYLEHPMHKKATAEILGPLSEKVLIYDIVE